MENIRTARRLISELKLGKVIDSLTFYTLDKDTSETETRKQLTQLQKKTPMQVYYRKQAAQG
ncbi:MAG: hypothetical protein R2822_23885 [Spirosomataceae bacterium]